MRRTLLGTAVGAVSLALLAAPAGSAPLSASVALKSADTGTVQTVRWVRGHYRHRIGPAAGLAAGAAIAPRYGYGYYDPGYGAYAYAPGYAPRRYYGGYYACTGDSSYDSAFPSWACPHTR